MNAGASRRVRRPRALLLAIDTSSRQSGVALFDDVTGLVAEYNWHSANRQTEELLPVIDLLLQGAGATIGELRAVGVALGPGSFSGLRVGLAAAKGLAMAGGLALIGIPSLDVAAFPHQDQPLPVMAVVQAGRGRVYYAPYAHGPSGWGQQAPAALGNMAAIASAATTPALFAGELTSEDRVQLEQHVAASRVVLLPTSRTMRRAGYLAELAWRRFAAGESDDPGNASPVYLQQPEGAVAAGLPGAGNTATTDAVSPGGGD